MCLCNVISRRKICYPLMCQEKRRSALLESNRPRDILEGLIKTMAPGGAGPALAPPTLAHRIERPLYALKNSFIKKTPIDTKQPGYVTFGNISKGDF